MLLKTIHLLILDKMIKRKLHTATVNTKGFSRFFAFRLLELTFIFVKGVAKLSGFTFGSTLFLLFLKCLTFFKVGFR